MFYTPRSFDRTLAAELRAIDDEADAKRAALPPGHTWRDLDVIEIARCEAAKVAYARYEEAEAAFEAKMKAEIDDEEAFR